MSILCEGPPVLAATAPPFYFLPPTLYFLAPSGARPPPQVSAKIIHIIHHLSIPPVTVPITERSRLDRVYLRSEDKGVR
jgi:hypothetical protein